MLDCAEVEKVLSEVAALEDDYGIELTEEEADAVAAQLQDGYTDEQLQAAFQQVAADQLDAGDEPGQYDEEAPPLHEDPEFLKDVRREYNRIEQTRGYPLTQREVDALAERFAEQAERYGEISGQDALADYHEHGGRKYDVDNNRHDRRAWMTERFNDQRAANQSEDDSDRLYDMDDRRDRVDYMAQRAQGAEFDDVEVPDEAA